MSIIEKDKAYFLHQAPYRDNSALVQLFTQKNGKVSFIINGITSKKNTKKAFLQPCRELTISYQLKPGLSKLTSIEFSQQPRKVPSIEQFMFYQYANELLLSILPQQLASPSLFTDYQECINRLAHQQPHNALRHIELALIILFSGIPTLNATEDSKNAVDSTKEYWFDCENGLFEFPQNITTSCIKVSGDNIRAFALLTDYYIQNTTTSVDETIAQGAKSISTVLINQLLNGKELKTRKVFKALRGYI